MEHSIQNYTKSELGTLENSINQEDDKVFLKDKLQLTACEISINVLPTGAKIPFSHSHKQNEEVYIFIKGCGTMTLDTQQFAIKEGTA